MKKRILFTALLMLTACANHTAGVMASSTGEVRVDNNAFHRQVTVDNVQTRYEGAQLTASGTLTSQVATDVRVQYKFTWFDINGFAIEDEGSSWKPVKLHGKQQLQVRAVAPNNTAVRCQLYVREAFSN